jgi:LPS O-antigen subunit length determinant protein (WzzB/FepE family)
LTTLQQAIDFRTIVRDWASGWFRIGLFTLLGIAAAFAYLHSATYRYTVSMEVASTDHTINPTLGQTFSLLGGGVAIGLREDLNTELFLAQMTSYEVAKQIAADPTMLRSLFRNVWDAERGQWKPPNSVTTAIKKFVGMPYSVDGTPTAYNVQQFLAKSIDVQRGTTSPVTTIEMRDTDREFAKAFLQRLYTLADQTLRARAVEQAQERVNFLMDYIAKSTVSEYREQLALGLMDQVRTLMAGKLPSAFSVYIISGPSSSDLPTSPSARVVVVSGALIGFVLAIASLSLFPSARRRRLARQGGFAAEGPEPLYRSRAADESVTRR